MRSAFALSISPMISLLFMKVFGGGAACWATALEANVAARNVKARNCGRMGVPPVIGCKPLVTGKEPPRPLQEAPG